MFKMENRELEAFASFLMKAELTPKDSRQRTRFIKILQDRIKEIESFRLDLINQYAEKDENDNLIIDVVDDQSMYRVKDLDKFNEEMEELLSEKFILECNYERKDMLMAIQKAVLDPGDNIKLSGNMALLYEKWCDIVEEINIGKYI